MSNLATLFPFLDAVSLEQLLDAVQQSQPLTGVPIFKIYPLMNLNAVDMIVPQGVYWKPLYLALSLTDAVATQRGFIVDSAGKYYGMCSTHDNQAAGTTTFYYAGWDWSAELLLSAQSGFHISFTGVTQTQSNAEARLLVIQFKEI